MSYLLDSHALLWLAHDDARLPARVRLELTQTRERVYVSIATAWELAIKSSIGKLDFSTSPRSLIEGGIEAFGLLILPVTIEHVERVGALPFHHRDPFDRMIVAQALVEGLTVVTKDDAIAAYGVPTLW